MHPDLIQRELRAFAADSKSYMSRLPLKLDRDGNVVEAPFTAFTREEIESKRYLTNRDLVRSEHFRIEDGSLVSLGTVPYSRSEAAIGWRDRPEDLVDRLEHDTLESIEAAGLRSSALDETPWSDDYWAIYLGQLGKRYADPGFPADKDWEKNYDYAAGRPASDILRSGDVAAIGLLSPAEKYDALIGDTSFTLTQFMWLTGKQYFDRYGEIETWMGVCHGWAPASYMLPRPRRAIIVPAADGTPIKFYPSDMKALATQLWAQARTASRFVGGRCNDKDVRTDEIGRVIDSKCFDTNPGTWHMAVVNQIGACRRSFVIDATYDYEVWNQGVHAYQSWYFNPAELAYKDTIEEATVAAGFESDRFAGYRHPEAKYVVGIVMEVAYVVETRPTHAETDGPESDAVQKVVYIYDLELDAERKIIGGEWYQNPHPDFLWTPPPGARATSDADRYVRGSWPHGSAVPESWRPLARSASRDGLPLAGIVEGLIERANVGATESEAVVSEAMEAERKNLAVS